MKFSLAVVAVSIWGLATSTVAHHGEARDAGRMHRRAPTPQDYSNGAGAGSYGISAAANPISTPSAAGDGSNGAQASMSMNAMSMNAMPMNSMSMGSRSMGSVSMGSMSMGSMSMGSMSMDSMTTTQSAANAGMTSGSWTGSSSQAMLDACMQTCQAKFAGGGGMVKSLGSASATTSAACAQPTGGMGTANMSMGNMSMGNVSMGNMSMGNMSMGNMSMTPLVANSPWEIIVAPMKGDLRMVPFNINAQPGQKITYTWGAGPHTVTESEPTSICNKSTSPGAFASGLQNVSFSFEVIIIDISTRFYYCSVPMHCQKGMFGLINGAVSTDPVKSFGGWGPMQASKDKAFGEQWSSTMAKCQGTMAENWGSELDMSQMPDWAQMMAGYSILATREYYAANPQLLAALSSAGSNATMGSNITSSSPSASATSGIESSSASAAATPSASLNGTAGSLAGGLTSGSSRKVNLGSTCALIATAIIAGASVLA